MYFVPATLYTHANGGTHTAWWKIRHGCVSDTADLVLAPRHLVHVHDPAVAAAATTAATWACKSDSGTVQLVLVYLLI